MRFGIGANGDRVGFELRQGGVEILEALDIGKFPGEVVAGPGAVGAKPDEGKTVNRAVGFRVTEAHRAEADDENADLRTAIRR